MTIATGSNVQESYVFESTPGVTPATPAFQVVPITSEGIKASTDTLEDPTIRKDGQLVDVINGNQSVAGDVPAVLRHGAFDEWIEAAMGGSWALDKLKAGTTRRTMTVERFHTDIGVYFRSTGVEVAGFTIEHTANALTTIAFNLVGLAQDPATAIITGAAYTDAATTQPMDSFHGSILINGGANAVITSISLAVDRGNEAQFGLGSNTAKSQNVNHHKVSGSTSLHFETLAEYNLFKSGAYFAIVLALADAAGNELKATLPRIKFTSADVPVSGPGGVMATFDFTATHDTTDETNLLLERSSA